MRVAILAGGLGTRLQEETGIKPKPMVEIGGEPILRHIMKIYACQGYDEFVIALGYRGDVIKDYFLNYRYHANSMTVDLGSGRVDRKRSTRSGSRTLDRPSLSLPGNRTGPRSPG